MSHTILKNLLTGIAIFSLPCFTNAQNGVIRGKVTNGIEVLPAATVILGNQTKIADVRGEFVFSIKAGKYNLVITDVGYKKIENDIKVTTDSVQFFEFVLEQSGEMGDEVILGSRAMKQRSNLNTPVPVDLIQFSKLPARQVELTRIIENTIPSFTAAAHGFREGKQTVPASLRALGPDHTLVLLNGRRLHTMASPWTFGVIGFGTVGVDLNAIPSAAIETVEVLRDGASAQYGSDAIAGVIDLQLKTSTGLTSIQLHTGQYYKGDGEAFSFSINHGLNFLKKGYLNLTADFRFNNYTQRNGEYDGTAYYNIPSTATPAQKDSIRKLDNQKIAERGFDRKNHRPLGDNKVLNSGFSINGGYPVNKSTSVFWTAVGNYRFCKDVSSNVYRYPYNNSTRINTLIYPDGFLPYIQSKTPDINLIGGLKGITNSGWHWDAGIIYGKNSSIIEVTNSNNASQQFTEGVYAPTSFNTGKQIFSQITPNINFSRALSNTIRSVKSLVVAFGTEFRIDDYRIQEGEEASWKNYAPALRKESGSQGQTGFQPENVINKNKQVIGAYAEVEMEKNEKLLMNLATRYEYYSDFGSNLTGKIAIRYKFSDWLLWRSSFSNGFRAPALQQGYYSLITSSVLSSGALVRTVTFRNDHEVVRALGISSLKPETSLNLTTGFTSSISKNISVTIDGYWIQIKNRIIYSGNISADSIPEVRIILDNFGYTDIQNVRVFSNAINTRTIGLDFVLMGRWSIGKSLLQTSLAANFNKTNLYDSILYAKNLPDNEKNRRLLVNREERCRVVTAYPTNKIIFDVVYKIGKWKFNSSLIRYGEVLQQTNNPVSNPDETFSPKTVCALNVCYTLKSWLSITGGAENIFNTYPDKLKYYSNTQNGLLIYNPNFAAFGVNGGYYFINMSFNF